MAAKRKPIKKTGRRTPAGVLEFALTRDYQCGDPIPKSAPWPFAVCELAKGHGGDVHATTSGRPMKPWNVHYWPIHDPVAEA